MQPGLIELVDANGARQVVSADEFYAQFSRLLSASWSDALVLRDLINMAVQDGRAPLVLSAARRLLELEPTSASSMAACAAVYVQTGELDEAGEIVNRFVESEGAVPASWLMLAKIASKRGDEQTSKAHLNRALQGDPNLDTAVQWWAALHGDGDAIDGSIAALATIGSQHGAWLPQLVTGQVYANAGQWESALRAWRDALLRSDGRLEVVETIMDAYGSAGAQWREDLLDLVVSAYSAARHGGSLGLRIVETWTALGEYQRAGVLLDELRARTPLQEQEALDHAEGLLRAAAARPVAAPQVRGVHIRGSIAWELLDSPPWMSTDTEPSAPRIGLLTSSVSPEAVAHDEGTFTGPESSPGRMTRGVTLWIADALRMKAANSVHTLFPVVPADAVTRGGPYLSVDPWNVESFLDNFDADLDVLVTSHLHTKGSVGLGLDIATHEIGQRTVIRTQTVRAGTYLGLAQNAASAVETMLSTAKHLQKRVSPSPWFAVGATDTDDLLYGHVASLGYLLANRGHIGMNAMQGTENTLVALSELWALHEDFVTPRLLVIGAFVAGMRFQPDRHARFGMSLIQLLVDLPPLDPVARLLPLVLLAAGARTDYPPLKEAWLEDASPEDRAWLEQVEQRWGV